jgi:hypothetical protein
MCLVIFSWLVAQDYFKEMTDNDVRKRIYEEQKNQIDQDMAPFGFISDGLDDMNVIIDEDTGDRWMFATNEKFGDTKEPGALSVMTELLDDYYDLEITQTFCKYFKEICNSNRPVRPKESWMLYEFFRLCKASKITVDDAYIASVAKSLRTAYSNDFDATDLYNRAKTSYQNWFLKNKPNPDGTLWGISYPERRLGMTFFVEQVAKNMTGPVPKLANGLWPVPAKDLL